MEAMVECLVGKTLHSLSLKNGQRYLGSSLTRTKDPRSWIKKMELESGDFVNEFKAKPARHSCGL